MEARIFRSQDRGRANENWNLSPFVHPQITEVFNAPEMDRSFQKPFLPFIGQFSKIGNILADDRAVF